MKAPEAPAPTVSAPPAGNWTRTAAACGLLLLLMVLGFLAVREYGITLPAPPPGASPFQGPPTGEKVDTLLHVLLALTVVIIVARAVGSLFQYLHQPAVVGEILAGILLGPSVLGRIAPGLSGALLPPEVAPFLEVLSQVGVILYMFLVGLELDPGLLRESGPATLVISHASIVTPFLMGAALALELYPRLSSADVPFTLFALFLGVAMSITAFPVLARILTDRRIHKSPMGVMALTCAAVNDVVGWCLLAFVVSVVQARYAGGLFTTVMAIGYIAVMLLVIRPAMARLALLYGTRGRLTQGVMAMVSVALLLSALATHYIGIHAVFGAFVLGAVVPHDSGLARELTDKLEDLVVVLLLPAFFAFTGMRTHIGLVNTQQEWILCGLIILVASLGKVGGSVVAARGSGLGWREAAALGVLMNTRGLMELIVLNIGLDLRIISAELFAMLVLMALVTTLATTPVLHLITRRRPSPVAPALPSHLSPVPVEAPRPAGVLVPISNPEGMAALIDLAAAATRPDEPAPRVLALVRRPAGGVRAGLRELERRVAPRAPILVAAMEHARERGLTLDLHAVWTDDPAGDILQAAADAHIEWLLIGHHRPVFGGDLLGGVVKQILERTAELPLRVGVVIHSHQRALQRVVAVVDNTPDGRAALDLASRVGESAHGTLHAVLVPREGAEPEPELAGIIKDAGRNTTRWLHTDVLTQRTPAHLAQVTRGDLVVIGTRLADELGLPLDDDPGDERCVVVVRGGTAV
jgi:Kef-type K+ transport system membrane component KefB